ncbi:hypothetical protein SRHO_G00011120 [Serrasalmus rhombeus]
MANGFLKANDSTDLVMSCRRRSPHAVTPEEPGRKQTIHMRPRPLDVAISPPACGWMKMSEWTERERRRAASLAR